MNKKNIKKLLLLTTMLGISGAAYSQSYMCMPCPTGTWSDGQSGMAGCLDMNDFNMEFEENPFIKLEKTGSGTTELEAGCYKLDIVAGGGGGGGGSAGWPAHDGGGGGGSGYRLLGHIFCTYGTKVSYTIGAGGHSTGYHTCQECFGPNGGTGGSSKITINNLIVDSKYHSTKTYEYAGGQGGFGGGNPGDGSWYYEGGGGAGYQRGKTAGAGCHWWGIPKEDWICEGDSGKGGSGGGPNGGTAGFGRTAGGDGKLGGGGGGGDDYSGGGKGGDGYIYIYKQK